ncbi:MAG: phosphotransferase [bacterium]
MEKLAKEVQRFLHNKDYPDDFDLIKLSGDASEREYYRIKFHQPVGGDSRTAHSVVIMHILEPSPDRERAFTECRAILEEAGVNVPHLFNRSDDGTLFLLEDFGDRTLEQTVAGREHIQECESLYTKAIDMLMKIQFEPMKQPRRDCQAFQLSFDEEKLMWELNFFVENAIRIYSGKTIAEKDEKFLREKFLEVVRPLAAEPRFFTHRDYHSRNLMVCGDEIGVLDFQDARMGLIQYDLVSLLRDSYISLPEPLVEKLKKYYMDSAETKLGEKINREHFEHIFLLMTVQRSLKAAGSFAYLDCVKKKGRYLQHLPTAVNHAISAMERLGMNKLVEIITLYIKE